MHATEKNKNLVKVVALALQRAQDKCYLLTRRGPGQSGAGEWEFPGGKIEPGESQPRALAREIEEELSIQIDEKKLQFLADHIEHYPQKSIHIFLWKFVTEQNPMITLTEHDQYKWVSRFEINPLELSSGDRPLVSYL